MPNPTWTTRRIEERDWEPWSRLFKSYGEFYESPISDEQLKLVWSWIHDEGSVEALAVLANDDAAEPVGIAHLRSWVRPLKGEVAGYLDDLFIDPDFRGTGAVDALFDAIRLMASDRGWNIVRWTTAADNSRAQAAYERVSARTGWVTYEMTVGDRPG